jgi:hypothetical protein
MLRALIPLIAAVLLLPASAEAATSCRSVRDVVPTGVADIPATHIRASGVTCRLARSLPRRVVLNARYGDLNDDYSAEALGIAAWDCDLGDFGERTTCRSGARIVSWRLGP